MFKGSIPALITPFKNDEIDWNAFDNLVEWQIEQGSHAVVPCGTSGESPTLSHDEHKAIIKRCVEIVKQRIPVLAGTGSNSTREAIALTQYAKQVGAEAALVVVPYYNKPTQNGMIAHYTAIHDDAKLPIIIYNIPGRSVVDMSNQTLAKLAELSNIIGVKDATGDLSRPLELARLAGKDFIQLSGDDITAAAFLAQGGHGVISVVANIAPKMCADMQNAWIAGDMGTFADLRDKLAPLGKDLFCESNPVPVKYAAKLLGICDDEVRLPLVKTSANAQDLVQKAIEYAGISAASLTKAA